MFEIVSTKLAIALISNELGYQSVIRSNDEVIIVTTIKEGQQLITAQDT